MSKNTTIIVIVIVGVLLVVGAGYFLFVRPATTTAVSATEPVSPAEATFVNLANQLQPLDFDTSILTDPRFEALVDIHTAILPEAAGRHDPFAPLGR